MTQQEEWTLAEAREYRRWLLKLTALLCVTVLLAIGVMATCSVKM